MIRKTPISCPCARNEALIVSWAGREANWRKFLSDMKDVAFGTDKHPRPVALDLFSFHSQSFPVRSGKLKRPLARILQTVCLRKTPSWL